MNDQTDSKKSDKAFAELRAEYKDFASMASHELQAPIRQLYGFSQQLLKELGPDLSPEQDSFKQMIDGIYQDAQQTLNALMMFSRFNTDEKFFGDVDLAPIMQRALKKTAAMHPKTDYGCDIKTLPNVYGDPELLLELFCYLLDNAFKFRNLDRPLSISVSCDAKDDQNVFCISDNGRGILERVQKDVFTILRSFSEEQTSARGVGLSFARKIVQIHEGEIWIESEEGRGTKVFFTLPLQP